MNETISARRTVRVYACGGCGTNIAAALEGSRKSSSPNVANIDSTYIDTADSNFTASIPLEHCYLFDGMDGSGKMRKENAAEITKRVKDILQKFEPRDLNIIIHSAGGGSGSVIGPSIASELLDKKAPVIVLMVGSADTRIDADNTLKTVKSYEAIVALRNNPLAMVFQLNSRENKREAVDSTLKSIIVSLAILWSGGNLELDSKDLQTFLNFQSVTTFKPQLTHLTLIEADGGLDAIGQVISVASLAKKGQDTYLSDVIPEVQYIGYVPDDADSRVTENVPLHFVLTDGIFADVGTQLSTALRYHEDQKSKRVERETLLTDADQPTQTGLVF
jgi:hypothetical protein